MTNNGKVHLLVLEVLTEDNCGQRQVQDRVHRWLETHAHTASDNRFEFISVGVLTGKRLSNAPRRSK